MRSRVLAVGAEAVQPGLRHCALTVVRCGGGQEGRGTPAGAVITLACERRQKAEREARPSFAPGEEVRMSLIADC